MHKDTITLFNRKPGPRGQGDTWYPTVITGCNLNIDRAAIIAKYGTDSQDKAVLFVRYSTDGENILVSGKPWNSPKEWDGVWDSLTFGTDGDFFWQGEWLDGIVTDEQYGSEGFYGYMNRTHDNVFSITAVAKYSVIPHFEIMGK